MSLSSREVCKKFWEDKKGNIMVEEYVKMKIFGNVTIYCGGGKGKA
jgi:hypothetical protein